MAVDHKRNCRRVGPGSDGTCTCGAWEDRIEALEAEIERLREALLRARQQIVDQQSMPDEPTWIDDVLASASQ